MVVTFSTKADTVYHHVRERILRGEVQPGQRLVARHLADELGVSEIPIRETLRRLQSDGLVTFTPHIGAVVAEPSRAESEEALAICAALEPLATRRAAVHGLPPEIVAGLERACDEMEAAAVLLDHDAFAAKNQAFHLGIYGHSASPISIGIIREMWYLSDRATVRAVFAEHPERMGRSNEEHRQILAAIVARDADRAEDLMRAHKRRPFELYSERHLRDGEHES
ncbi:MAG: GntR family transcriptional regulator [Armatimonadetes bacterium]|nr:GntR family transcriptional regulator [Armatimonadota bacterium]